MDDEGNFEMVAEFGKILGNFNGVNVLMISGAN